MNNRNPWRGLASYEEPQGTSDDYLFCGRDEETIDLVRLIDNNLFITLYGSSGIGKTSLLKAGVVPILRRKDYLPLYVRLSQKPKDLSYAEAIVKKLQNSDLKEERSIALEHPDGNDRLYLWNYFAATRFYNSEGREVYPVVILDQFEEVFRDADKRKAELLLQQIYLLLNDELEMPNQEHYNDETNYRFVASIREDFLFVLEDSIDEFSLDLYKNNRYRLRPMKPENARQVVLFPGRDCIEETEKKKIAERVLKLARKTQSDDNIDTSVLSDDIDTLLLSLVCASTYDKKKHEKISLEDLNIWKDNQGKWIVNPMKVYYRDATVGLPANKIRYIQQHLIRDDGSRKKVDAEEVKAALSNTTYNQLTQSTNRLFAFGDKGKVELLHDQLALAVFEERKTFEEKERKKKLKRRIRWIGVGVFVALLVLAFFALVVYIQRQDLLRNQSRFVAKEAVSLFESGNPYLAALLANSVLPQNLSHPMRPYTLEAEYALRKALSPTIVSFRGHSKAVNSVTISPNNKLLASASNDRTIMIWDTETGECIQTLKGHNDGVLYATFLFDNDHIVSASKDKTIKIWEIKSGNCTKTLTGHTNWVFSVNVSPDNKNLVSASNDHTIMIWDIANGSCIDTLIGHDSRVYSAVYSKEGDYILSASMDKTAKIWNAKTGKCIKTMVGHNSYVTSACFSPDNLHVATSSNDSTIRIWDIQTEQCLRILKGHTDWVNSVSYSSNGKHIVSASIDNSIRIWDTKQDSCLCIITRENEKIQSAYYCINDACIVFCSSGDNVVGMWFDDENQHQLASLEGHKADVNAALYSSNGNVIVSCSSDNTTKLWDSKTGQCLRTIGGDNESSVNSCDISYDGKRIVTAEHLTIKVWDAETGAMIDSLNGHTGIVRAVKFVPNNYQIVSGSEDKTTKLWEANGVCQQTLKGSLKSISCDGKTLVCSSGGTIVLYDIETFQATTMDENTIHVYSTAISPDRKTIVSGSYHTISLWDIETSKCIKSVENPHLVQATSVAYSPNGQYIVTALSNQSIVFWDSELRQRLLTIHTNSTQCSVCFDPLGDNVVSSSSDGTVRIWYFPPLQELIDQTRERFKDRPLTDEERRMYYLE